MENKGKPLKVPRYRRIREKNEENSLRKSIVSENNIINRSKTGSYYLNVFSTILNRRKNKAKRIFVLK